MGEKLDMSNSAIGERFFSTFDEQLDAFELQFDIFVLLTSEIYVRWGININIWYPDASGRDEHSTVDLEATRASRACSFLCKRFAVLAELSLSLADTWFEATTDDPEATFSVNVQAGLLAVDDDEALKEAKGETVPENAENAFVVAARFTHGRLKNLIV